MELLTSKALPHDLPMGHYKLMFRPILSIKLAYICRLEHVMCSIIAWTFAHAHRPLVILPVFGKERCNRVREYFALVVDIPEDVLGPLHQISDLVARRWTINIPRQLLFDLIPQNILELTAISSIHCGDVSDLNTMTEFPTRTKRQK